MARNEKTSPRIAALAGRGIIHPGTLTLKEVSQICASVLTQAPDRKRDWRKPAKAKKAAAKPARKK